MLADLVVLAAVLWLGYACLKSLITTEIGFGHASRTIRLADDSSWFWFAFWFQFILAVGGVLASWYTVRKRVAAIRAVGQREAPPTGSED